MYIQITKKTDTKDAQTITDTLAEECCFRLLVEGECQQEFFCLPADLEELALGFLFAEGYLSDKEEVTFPAPPQVQKDGSYEITAFLNSNGKQGKKLLSVAARRGGTCDMYDENSGTIRFERAMFYAGQLLKASRQFVETGCIHSAALCKEGKLHYIGEDISRFFALYKAIGKAIYAGDNPGDFVLCTTGRLPFPYMQRVIRSGMSCVISRSAPTSASIELANQFAAAVFGFARADKVNYYPPFLAVCLLAGGEGKRADGADKALFLQEGVTFAERIIKELDADGECLISYNREPENLEAALASMIKENRIHLKYKIIKDLVPGVGPIAGIYTALKQSKSGAVLFAPCDLPFYSRELTQAAKDKFTGLEDAVVFKEGSRIHPLCGIYHKSCIPVIEQMLKEQEYSIKMLLSRLRVSYLEAKEAGINPKVFSNINTLQEYESI